MNKKRLWCGAASRRHGVDGAHRAGFSDAAHMTRTFRNMLGTTPSDLAMRQRLATGVSVDARAPKISLTGASARCREPRQ